MSYYGDGWRPYVSVAERRVKARKQMDKLRKKGKEIQPVELDGRTIARSFWGKGWCDHLESFSDYANRLPRGRAYVRNGSVCHLDIQPGRIEAIVSGSELYNVQIDIKKLKPSAWQTLKKDCTGQIGSILELLQGKLSHQVMALVTDRSRGLFPQPGEMAFTCSCPDWAMMCKHVAAVLYGVGSRLDGRPELLFLLRDVEAEELITAEIAFPVAAPAAAVIADDRLGDIFGIEIDLGTADRPKAAAKAARPATRQEQARKPVKEQPSAHGRKAVKGVTPVKRGAAPQPKKSAGRKREAAKPFVPTGPAIAKLRKAAGLSVEQFAQHLGVSAASVYRWETFTAGKLKLQARSLAALTALQRRTGKKSG